MLSRRLVRIDTKSIVLGGLIGYWHFSKGVNSTGWQNISPNTYGNYNATINGAFLQPNCVYFNGINNYVTIPPLNFTGDVTYEIILNIKKGINIIGNNVGNSVFRLLRSSGAGLTTVGFTSLGNYSMTVISFNTTIHVCVRYNSINKRADLFIDGIFTESITNTNFVTPNFSNFSLILGAFTSASSFSEMELTSLKMYTRALQDAEIAQNFGVGLDRGI